MIEQLQNAVAAWPGVQVEPHRFGGIQFNLGGVEVGHVHRNGMVDIPFKRSIRDQLIAEARALPHHLLVDTGWITFYMRSPDDLERAIWLFRLSYLFNARRRTGQAVVGAALDVNGALAALEMSADLRAAFG